MCIRKNHALETGSIQVDVAKLRSSRRFIGWYVRLFARSFCDIDNCFVIRIFAALNCFMTDSGRAF